MELTEVTMIYWPFYPPLPGFLPTVARSYYPPLPGQTIHSFPVVLSTVARSLPVVARSLGSLSWVERAGPYLLPIEARWKDLALGSTDYPPPVCLAHRYSNIFLSIVSRCPCLQALTILKQSRNPLFYRERIPRAPQRKWTWPRCPYPLAPTVRIGQDTRESQALSHMNAFALRHANHACRGFHGNAHLTRLVR